MGLFDHFPYTNMHELNLSWILEHLREILAEVSSMHDWVTEHEKEYEELKQICDNLNNGTLTPALQRSLKIWIDTNLQSLIGYAIKNVFFGLTDDGYFVAYIPDSWDEIQFSTSGLDDFITGLDYGHLILSY